MKEALLLIDIQNMYFSPGKYKLFNPEEAAKKAAVVLEQFRKQGKCVVHIKHDFKVGEDQKRLKDIHELVAPINGETVIEKKYPSSFLQTNLQDELKKNKIDKLVVVGMMSHMCVDTTVRACQDYGYQVKVIEDACTTKNISLFGNEIDAMTVHKSFMAALDGMFAKVMKLDEYLK